MRARVIAGFILVAGMGVAFTLSPPSPSRPRAHTSTPSPSPSGSSAASGSPSPASSEAPRDLVIHATGDVNLDPGYVSGLAAHGFAFAWSGIGDLFRTDDLSIVNMECPVATGGIRQVKSYTFLGDPRALPAMRAAGVDVATLANNHSIDYGIRAMLDTRRNLIANDVIPAGGGRNVDEALQPAIVSAAGRRIAVISLADNLPTPSWGAGPARPGIASARDFAAVSRAIRSARTRADVVVVAVHWGIELGNVSPTARQRTLGRALIDAGADVVFGHGPHVIHPLEWYRGRPIFLGLGNFVWSRSFVEAFSSGIAEVRVSADGRFTARLRPTYLEASGHPVLRG